MKFEKYASASELPATWDVHCTSYFQERRFLSYAERYNPCGQRYYVLSDDLALLAGACVYTLTIDLFTYAGFKSPVRMTVVGVPASVSCSGIIGRESVFGMLLQHIYKEESGIILALNLPPKAKTDKGILLRTLPGVEMHHHFSSWEEYLAAMRSTYRRRIHMIRKSFEGASKRVNGCSAFTGLHYSLYLQVWKRSKTRLEKLSPEFFSNLPGEFTLVSYFHEGRLAAWHILLKEEQDLVFFYGGTNYEVNRKIKAYYNNLAGIVKEAIEGGFRRIDLGQTAEIAKTRFGASIVEKNMIAFHRNPLARAAIKLARPLLEYRRRIPAANVLKNK